jgi:hypothetical protein
MNLLDRYLDSVRAYLPAAQQTDIVAELSENIRAQMEEKAEELGRPLTEAEQEIIIRQHGHPIFVAGRYLPRQFLIGPALFPIYWFTLKTVVPIAYVILVVVAFVTVFPFGNLVSTGEPLSELQPSLGGIFWFVSTSLVAITAVVTILFAFVEYYQPRLHFLQHWSVRKLSRPLRQSWTEGEPMSRGQSVTLLLISVAVIVGALLFPGFPVIYAPGVAFLSQHGQMFLLSMMSFPVLTILETCVNLVRPRLTWHRPVLTATRAACGAAGLIFARMGDLVQLTDRGRTALASVAPDVPNFLNGVVFWAVLLGFCIYIPGCVISLIRHIAPRIDGNSALAS